MLDRIAGFITRHNMFPPSARVGVAVSGGADSVFLLQALRELAPRWNLQLSVVHIEHGIRGADSRADAVFVKNLAGQLQLPFHFHQADVPAIDDNLEQGARRVRQAFFATLLSTGKVDRIATGHTRSDQAETVLYRILRGSGLAGLSGIRPVTADGMVRPLLELDRAEIECWLRKHNIEWREDATNQDRAYARNRLRHEILPLLRQTFNPRLDETLSGLATLAQDEESYWVAELSRHQLLSAGNAPQVIPVSQLATLPRALARRLIRRGIELVKGDLRQIEFAHVERILKMAQSEDGHDRVQLPGVDIMRSFEWIRMAPVRTGQTSGFVFSCPIQPPASLELPDGFTRITLQVLEKAEFAWPCGTVVDELDWELFGSPDAHPGLEVRNWRPGDKYQPMGYSHKHKIKQLFQDARVPLWERRHWPIITYNEVIVWAKRFGAAAGFAANRTTRRVLEVAVSSECGNRLDRL